MKNTLLTMAVIVFLPARLLLAMEAHQEPTRAVDQRPGSYTTKSLHLNGHESTATSDKPENIFFPSENKLLALQETIDDNCSSQPFDEASAKEETPIVEYGRNQTIPSTNKFCIEQRNAKLQGTRQQLLNLLTEAYLLKQQAENLHQRTITSQQKSQEKLPVNEEILDKVTGYPQKASQMKTLLAQVVAETNRIRNEITVTFNRLDTAYQSNQHGLTSKGSGALDTTFKNMEEKVLSALHDLQTAKEIFELLELKIDITGEFIALFTEEGKKQKKRMPENKEGEAQQIVTRERATIESEKVFTALALLDAIGKEMHSGAINTQSPSPHLTIRSSEGKQAPSLPEKPAISFHKTEKRNISQDHLSPAFAQSRTPDSGDKIANSTETTEVETILKRWAQAWSEQNIVQYLEYYADSFVPAGGKTRNKWQNERAERLSKPQFIKVRLENFQITPSKNGGWQVETEQQYTSDLYSDHVKKVFELLPTEKGLKIIREETREKL